MVRLGLGTAQFGLDYGISNLKGKTEPDEVAAIFHVAIENNISVIDTAAMYGCSEYILGNALPEKHNFSIITKTPCFSHEKIDASDALLLEQTFLKSLNTMHLASSYGLLIHHADNLLVPGGHLLMETMQSLKCRGLVKKIGVSVYTGMQINRVLDDYGIDIIQLPISVFDQRLLKSGHLSELKRKGIEIHARSIFLQGLLLMEPSQKLRHSSAMKKHLTRYHADLKRKGLTPLQAAMGFISGVEDIDVAVCGVNNHLQLQEICLNAAVPLCADDFADYAIADDDIVNPSRWKIK